MSNLAVERLEDRTLPSTLSLADFANAAPISDPLRLGSLLGTPLDTSSGSVLRDLGLTEITFFQDALNRLTTVQPALPKDVAELDDLLAKFNYLTTQNQVTVAFAVSIRSEIDDFLLGKPQLAAKFKALVTPFDQLVSVVPGAEAVIPFRTFIKLVRITASLETQDPSTVLVTLFKLGAGFGVKIDDPKGESLISLQAGFPDQTAITSNLDLSALLDSSLDTSSNSPLRAIGLQELSFFQKVRNRQTPVQPALSPKDLAELDDILAKFDSLTTHDKVTVQFAISIRSEIDDLFLGRTQLAAALGAQIGQTPINVEFVKPLELLVSAAPSAGPVLPFGTFIEFLRIAASLESGQTLLVTITNLDTTFGGIDDSSGQTLIFLQRADTLSARDLQAVTSSASANASKDQLQDEFFKSVSAVIAEPGSGATSGNSESSLVSGSGNPPPSALLPIPRSESGSAELNSDLPVAVVVGNPFQEPPIVRPTPPGSLMKGRASRSEQPPVPEPGPAPPVSAETPLNNILGGFGEALRRYRLVPKQKSTEVQSGLDSGKPMSSATIPAAFGQWLASVPSEARNSAADVFIHNTTKPEEARPVMDEKGTDSFLLENAGEEATASVEPLVAALVAAGVCHARWADRERYQPGTHGSN